MDLNSIQEKQYQSWDLQDKDADKVKALLDNSGKYDALEMKEAFADGFQGWWYGTFYHDQIICAAYITKQFVYLCGRERDAMMNLGKSLGRAQGKRSSSTTHSVFGSNDMVQAFWQGFQNTGKNVVSDQKLNLYQLTEIACDQNTAYEAKVAGKKDFALVFDFLGAALIDELGMDVRRVSKESHEKYCQQMIANGLVLLGYHRGKPAFVTCYKETPVGIFIEHPHFPVAMRRPKVMRGIHARIAELLLEKSSSILIYNDITNEEAKAAYEEVGYELLSVSRLMRLR